MEAMNYYVFLFLSSGIFGAEARVIDVIAKLVLIQSMSKVCMLDCYVCSWKTEV